VPATRWRSYLTFEVLIRMLADVLIVNASYLAALILRLLWRIATYPGVSAQAELAQAARTYGLTFWLLTIIALTTYTISGLYTRGRFQRGPTKALLIFEAVSVTYLLFGSILYVALARSWLRQGPGTAFVLAWFLALLATEGTRLWAVLWQRVMSRERVLRRAQEPDGRIRHVLVIGGAGYIGSVLCRRLLEKGYWVRVLDALLYGRQSVEELRDHPRFELLEGDSRSVSDVFRAMLDMDAVVHLGELVGDPACALDEALTLEINLAATRMVAEAAKGYGIRLFVYASSCSVYGAGDELLNERSALRPVSLYARAKIGAEEALLGLNDPDFRPVILRFATVYGLSPRPRFDLVINLLVAKAVREGVITVYGGNQWRPFVHVEDVGQAIIKCLEAPLASVKGRVFNVGSDEQNHTIAKVGELIQALIPEAQLVSQGQLEDRRDYHVSFARIRNELGFVAEYTLEEGVREIEAALRDGRLGDYRQRRYSNYQTLSDPDDSLGIRLRHINKLYAAPHLDPAWAETGPSGPEGEAR
jgi:nucleoside-diphosphate-sugar epimerase